MPAGDEGGCRLERVRDGEVVDGGVVVQPGVALARVEGAGEREGELADEAVVRDAEVAQLEGEADEVGDEVGGVDAAVDEDGAVDVGVAGRGVDGRLGVLAATLVKGD